MARRRRSLYLDMDEVLVDFVSPFLRVLNVPRFTWPVGVYDISKATGLPSGDVLAAMRDLPSTWWASLSTTAWMESLVALSVWFDDVVVLTSPRPYTAEADAGKRAWMNKWLPDVACIVCPDTMEKSQFSGPGKWLIDDSDANIEAWSKHGGEGVLFPRPWNRLHQFAGDPMQFVTERVMESCGRVIPQCHDCGIDMVRHGRPSGADYAAGRPASLRMFRCPGCGDQACG